MTASRRDIESIGSRQLYLVLRSLGCHGGAPSSASARAAVAPEVAAALLLVFQRVRQRAPSALRNMAVYGGALGLEYTLFFPLFAKQGNATACLSSVHNSPSLLRAFWREALQYVFDIELPPAGRRDALGDRHPLVFAYYDHEIEVTDEWGPDWHVVVRPAGRGALTRSRSSTPEQ